MVGGLRYSGQGADDCLLLSAVPLQETRTCNKLELNFAIVLCDRTGKPEDTLFSNVSVIGAPWAVIQDRSDATRRGTGLLGLAETSAIKLDACRSISGVNKAPRDGTMQYEWPQ